MDEEKPKCPRCGKTENIHETSRTETFDEPVINYKCLNCGKTF